MIFRDLAFSKLARDHWYLYWISAIWRHVFHHEILFLDDLLTYQLDETLGRERNKLLLSIRVTGENKDSCFGFRLQIRTHLRSITGSCRTLPALYPNQPKKKDYVNPRYTPATASSSESSLNNNQPNNVCLKLFCWRQKLETGPHEGTLSSR